MLVYIVGLFVSVLAGGIAFLLTGNIYFSGMVMIASSISYAADRLISFMEEQTAERKAETEKSEKEYTS